jgi:hypothetical protein
VRVWWVEMQRGEFVGLAAAVWWLLRCWRGGDVVCGCE